MKRRAFLGALIGGFRCRARAGQSARALAHGVEYLWNCQDAQGGWHSKTYGLLRSGQSLTPLVLNALLDAGSRNATRVDRAMAFIERNVNADGALGLSDDLTADYPCYATALALRAIVRTRSARHPLAQRMIAWLREQQMSPENGWQPGHAAFGAWGIGGPRRQPPESGHVDLSMTRHVLEALAAAGVRPSDPSMRQARVFVERCLNRDRSFFFSTVEQGANKAGDDGGNGFNGYGTATADGVLCLVAIGADAQSSLEWLRHYDHPILPPGFNSEARRRYAEGLRYYYADAVSRAFRAACQPRSVPFAAALQDAQRRDGSWSNGESLVKEDDPLIATAFAVSALAKSHG